MTAAGNILAGARATASMLQGIAPDAAVKAADETVTDSATLQNDNDLFLPLPSTGTWAFQLWLAAVGTVATGSGDIKVAFTWPTGASCLWSGIGFTAAASPAVNITAVRATSGTSSPFGAGTSEVGIWLTGTIIMGGTAGDLQLEFAQNTASAGNSITVKAGSSLMAWQIA